MSDLGNEGHKERLPPRSDRVKREHRLEGSQSMILENECVRVRGTLGNTEVCASAILGKKYNEVWSEDRRQREGR